MNTSTLSAQLDKVKPPLLRALLFTAMVNFSSILEYLRFGDASVGALSDVDEIVYLAIPYLRAQLRGVSAIFAEHDVGHPIAEILRAAPNAWIDFLLGSIAHTVHLTPVQLGLFLDLPLTFLSYLCCAKLFRSVSGSAFSAELATWTTLLVPIVLLLTTLEPDPPSIPDWVVTTAGNGDLGKMPITRAVYTQVSYPFFAIIVMHALAFVTRRDVRLSRAATSAAASAMLFYLYLFAWASAVFLSFGLLCIGVVLNFTADESENRVRNAFAPLAIFILLHGVLLIPGSLLNQSFATSFMPELRSYLFLSVERSALGVAFAFGAFTKRRSPESFALLSFIALCFFGEQILTNLQTLMGRPLCPYHFAGLYLYPFAGGALICFLVSEASKTRVLRAGIAMMSLLLILMGVMRLRFIAVGNDGADSVDNVALIEFLRSQPTRKVLAMINITGAPLGYIPQEFSVRAWPLAVSLLTGNHLLHQNWIGGDGISPAELIRREQALGFFFFGEPRTLWPCTPFAPKLPGDIFSLTWTFYLLERASACTPPPPPPTPCEILNEFTLDEIIFEKFTGLRPPSWLEEVSTLIFSSPNGEYQVYELSKARAIEKFGCVA